MPELPEVETVVRDLRPLLIGKRIVAIAVGKKQLRRPWRAAWSKLLLGNSVEAVRRRGKWILIDLRDDVHLVVHLGMTGQLRVQASAVPCENHTHLVCTLEDGIDALRFRDIRRFGSATVFTSAQAVDAFLSGSGLGPEPFALDARYWRERLQGTERFLKAILLDQRVLAGVGNIYADESLFAARLHPTRRGCDLSAAQAKTLRQSIAAVLTRAIEQRGSSIRDYVGGSGLKGAFQDEHAVYGRTGAPCRRCQTPIVRMLLAGRSTHFCPRCQPQEKG